MFRLFIRAAAVLGLAVVGIALPGTPASAQGLMNSGGPAETPPASFTENQYVDSEGCVFIRAGYGGNVTWVPRVTRSREALCGYVPSLSAGQLASVHAATGAPPAAASAPVTITATPAPPAQTRTVVTVQPQTAAPAPTPAPAPVQTRTQTRSVVTQPQGTSGCPGIPGLASQYMTGSGVRCGPQAVHPGDAARGVRLDPASYGGSAVVIPEGYRAAWDDGRLNPLRGVGTASGQAQMEMVWTNTIPRQLVARAPTARVMTTVFSSRTPEAAATGTPQPVATRAVATPTALSVPETGAATPEVIRVRVPSGHNYVQAATFVDRAGADAARARLTAQGLPTRLGGIQRESGQVFVVLAGPFDSIQMLGRALVTTQRAGFEGAFTRE